MKYLKVQERTDWPVNPPYPQGAWLYNGMVNVVDPSGQWYMSLPNGVALLSGSTASEGGNVDVHRLFDQILELVKK
jgi:hypothetical protein